MQIWKPICPQYLCLSSFLSSPSEDLHLADPDGLCACGALCRGIGAGMGCFCDFWALGVPGRSDADFDVAERVAPASAGVACADQDLGLAGPGAALVSAAPRLAAGEICLR